MYNIICSLYLILQKNLLNWTIILPKNLLNWTITVKYTVIRSDFIQNYCFCCLSEGPIHKVFDKLRRDPEKKQVIVCCHIPASTAGLRMKHCAKYFSNISCLMQHTELPYSQWAVHLYSQSNQGWNWNMKFRPTAKCWHYEVIQHCKWYWNNC